MAVQYGIIGCGSISRFHFHGLKKAGARVVHVVDADIEKARLCAKGFDARFSPDYRELLKDAQVTAVIILAPTRLHKAICLEVLESGKDIICEKTLADSAGESYDIVQAVRRNNRLFFTAFMKRFFPAVAEAGKLLPSLGRIFSVHARSYQSWGNLYDLQDAGEYEWILKNYGGGILKCAGSHVIDLVLLLCGKPVSLYSHIDYVKNSGLDRKATALFEYPNGLVVNFEAAAHPLERIGYERNSWDERIEINGTGGRIEIYTVRWDTPENNPALLVHYDNSLKTSVEYRFAPVNPFDLELEYFHSCLSGRRQGSPGAVDGFYVDAVIEAMGESHARKRPVVVDWRGL